MDSALVNNSRRDFVTDAARLAAAFALTGCATAQGTSESHPMSSPLGAAESSDWDLGWLKQIAQSTDRAVFDWPSMGDPSDPIVLELAERYLDNCAAAYGKQAYSARVVLNVRTQAVGAALSDALWERYALGVSYEVKDPTTQKPATRNPFMYRAPSPAPGITVPTLGDLVARGAIVLVCDFALGHLARRLGTKVGRPADEVHRDLRMGFVAGAVAVPSGIYGLARAQNSGCAYIRV